MTTQQLSPFDYKITRMRKNIRLREIAEYLDYSPSMISKFENGHVHFTEDKISKYTYFINTYQDNN